MSAMKSWWSRFGNFSPGLYNLPHMGEVIAQHRKRRYKTQEEFAIATGVDKRTVQEWETNIMIVDMGRRIFLAKLLKIPPALLGLNWHQLYDENQGEDTNLLDHMAEIIEEDAFYTYEDILLLGWECIYKGGAPQIAYRVNRRLRKLQELVRKAPLTDKEAWKALLCQFYHLSGGIAQHRPMYDGQALDFFTSAISLANELEESESLLAASFFHRADAYKQLGNFAAARHDILAAMNLIDHTSATLKGNIYLHAADINGMFVGSSQKEKDTCKQWQEKVATMLYKGNIEDEGTFLKLNLAAVNHEKAKLLLRFNESGDDRALPEKAGETIRGRLIAALNTVPANLTIWKMFFYLTEARLYLAEHDLEGSAKVGKEALKVAKMVNSAKGMDEVKALHFDLHKRGSSNPYIDNLGVELGLY